MSRLQCIHIREEITEVIPLKPVLMIGSALLLATGMPETEIIFCVLARKIDTGMPWNEVSFTKRLQITGYLTLPN